MPRRLRLILAASLSLAGLTLAVGQDTSYDDARNPHYKQAQQYLDNNNPTAAAAEYEAALAANPTLADAQYQLGILYGEKLQDPISSIYHFKHYLVLQPNSEHAANAKQMMAKEAQIFAASLPNSAQSESDMSALKTQNAALKKQADDASHTIAQLQGQLAQAATHHPAATAAGAPTAAAPDLSAVTDTGAPTTNAAPTGPRKALPLDATNTVENPAAPGAGTPDAGPSRTYTVVKGDKLWTIAKRMYPGHTKEGVEKIQEANKDALGTKPLKIGQVLIIPQ
jgi:nucleoid-associated protein YgaU